MDRTTQDVTSFSGFGSWLSSFSPDGASTQDIHEVDGGGPHRLYQGETEVSRFELPGDDRHVGDVELPADGPSKKPVDDDSTKIPDEKKPDVVRYPTTDRKIGPPAKKSMKPDPAVSLSVQGLKRAYTGQTFTASFQVSAFTSLVTIEELLVREGYEAPIGFELLERPLPKALPISENMWESWPVLVTDGPSSFDVDAGLRINHDEQFGTYLSKLQVHVQCKGSELSINNGNLQVGFHRTLRVPDDGNIHYLPADFGLLSLNNIGPYAEKLRKSNNASLVDMANKSGVFFPMYQREAMWISFRAKQNKKYAIRVFVGGINIVSGRRWDAPPSIATAKQDYIVVPPQEHLDGIANSRDTVKQFVAMPIGSGYSIEKQMTGKEDIGGLQLEITPSGARLEISLMSSRGINTYKPGIQSSQCPRDIGISVDDDVFLFQDGNEAAIIGGSQRSSRPNLLREFWVPSPIPPAISLSALYKVSLNITGSSSFYKRTISTPEYSPFTKLAEIVRQTTLHGTPLTQFKLFRGTQPLVESDTLVSAGLFRNPEIIARGPGDVQASESSLSSSFSICCCFADRKSSSQGKVYEAYSAPLWQNSGYNYAMSPQYRHELSDMSVPALETQNLSAASPLSYVPRPQQATFHRQSNPPPTQSFSSPQSYASAPQSYTSAPELCASAPQSYASAPQSHASEPQSYTSAPQSYASPHSTSQNYQSISASIPGLRPQLSPSYQQAPSREPVREGAEAWSMGLAAGGQLKQQILPDTERRWQVWNKSGTSVVSVQILNSVAFEAVTGMLTPVSPITLETYLAAGIPFFNTYAEKSADTEGGQSFRAIKSVGEIDQAGGIKEGVSVAESQKVACTVCRKNLCDCILRPCNHAFCSTCVYSRMTGGERIICMECHTTTKQVLGFSAPMGLPGEEQVGNRDVPVVVLPGFGGVHAFTSIAEVA